MTVAFVVLAQVLAFWPTWAWYVARVSDGSDEPWGIAALIIAVIYAGTRKLPTRKHQQEIPFIVVALMSLYFAAGFFLPPLIRAAIALSCLSISLSQLYLGKRFHLGLFGLLLISLPLIASLQFYAGYPVRLLTTQLASWIVNHLGQSVEPNGTALLWRGDIVSVDAPCSGIKMLWGGLLVSFTLSCFNELNNLKTWLVYMASNLFIFIANILRTSTLFFTESKLIPAPEWMHPAIGILYFGICVVAISTFCTYLKASHALENPVTT